MDTNAGLPEGWAMVKATDVCQVNPRKPPTNALPADAPVTFAPMAAVEQDLGAITDPEDRLFGEVRPKSFTPFAEGDVLFAKITPCMENGKAAVARGLSNGLGFGTTEFHVFRSNGAVVPEYLYHYIRQQSFRDEARAHMSGAVGQLRVPANYVKQFELPLPPLAEQERIVQKIEAVLSRVRAVRKRLAAAPDILKHFRQAVLVQACSGKLTEEWRATRVCDNSQHSQQTKAGTRSKGRKTRSAELAWAWEVPKEWKWLSLDQAACQIVDCPHSTPKWSDTGEICLRTTNFKRGKLDLSEVRRVSEEIFDKRNTRLIPKGGDVVYSREGGILGIACMIPDRAKVCLGQRMMLIRPSVGLCDATFIMNVLNSAYIVDRVRDLTGGTASPHLNVGDVKQFPVPLPSLVEQNEIVRRVNDLFAFAESIECRVAQATKRVEALTQSILARAYRGELVTTEADLAAAEGRDYETAEQLLARIRDASEDTKTGRPRRRREVTT